MAADPSPVVRARVDALLAERHPGRANAAFRYQVRAAVRLILQYEHSGRVAVPAGSDAETETLNMVSRVLAGREP